MGYCAKAVANFFLYQRDKSGVSISPLKLQKLIYIAHGWHWALHHTPLIHDEHVEAWRFGPVYPSIYHEFKHLGNDPIQEMATEIELIIDQENESLTGTNYRIYKPDIPLEDDTAREFLMQVWDAYKNFSAIELSNMTHALGTPWHETTSGGTRIKRNEHIPEQTIKNYYRKLADLD